jgi:enoyl-CoA hydratase/carnithine racemase
MPVDFEKQGKIGVITINRPEKLNALDGPTSSEVNRLLQEVDQDPEIWVGIVTSAGDRAFSAGADLKTMHRVRGPGEARPGWQAWRAGGYAGGLEVSKPLIAAIHGYCLAGGLELALMCDIRVATEDSQFGTPEVKWNILHGYGAIRTLDFMSMSQAMYLLLTGEFIDARKALEWGLITEVVPTGDDLKRSIEIAERICENGPVAVRMTKELVKRGREMALHDALRLYREFNRAVNEMEDTREGNAAFAERRKPNFSGH